jgi:hypothetical protein
VRKAKIVSFIIEKLKKEKYPLIFGWKEEETNKSKIK